MRAIATIVAVIAGGVLTSGGNAHAAPQSTVPVLQNVWSGQCLTVDEYRNLGFRGCNLNDPQQQWAAFMVLDAPGYVQLVGPWLPNYGRFACLEAFDTSPWGGVIPVVVPCDQSRPGQHWWESGTPDTFLSRTYTKYLGYDTNDGRPVLLDPGKWDHYQSIQWYRPNI